MASLQPSAIRRRVICLCVSGTVCMSFVPRDARAQDASASARSGVLLSEDAGTAIVPPIQTRNALSSLLHDSVGDFKRLPSKETATWLAVGAAIALAGHSVDRPVTNSLSAPRFDEPLDAGATLGGYHVQLGAALATFAVGNLSHQPKLAAVGSDLLRAQIITKTFTVALKTAVQRTRPDGTAYSFPSGHTSASFATATVLQRHFGWKVGVPAYAAATYVATSRIQEKRHFLSDVAFGAAIGIVAGRTVTVGRGDHRFAVAPMAVAGGGGVSFSLVGRN